MVALFRFFTRGGGVGSLPAELRAQFEPEGILGVAEKVGVRQRFSGSIPGCHSGVSVTFHKGLLVFTHRRLYALIPTLMRLKEPAIDQPWAGTKSGPAKATVDSSGVTLTIALGRVDPRFSGELSARWKTPLDDELLNALPTRELRFAVTPAYVFSSLGVRVRP